jgi:hypothetical protein
MAEYPIQELKNRITDQFHENHEKDIDGELLQETLHDVIDSVVHETTDAHVPDKYYLHDQGVPSAVWTITHNLNKKPAIMAFDSAGTEVVGSVQIIDDNNITITFTAGFSGKATCN